jgi:predicted metal-dependent hydrolase
MALKNIIELNQSQTSYKRLLNELAGLINDSLHSVEEILSHQRKSPADLAIRSRRAYQWMKFLSDLSNLNTHLDALQRIIQHLPTLVQTCPKRMREIDFFFYHISPLYKTQTQSNRLTVIVNESFIFASDKVLLAILESVLFQSRDSIRDIIRNHTSLKDYQDSREYLEYLSIPSDSYSRGKYYNLSNSFERVNKNYFQGKLRSPHLRWSRKKTKRKYGHFQVDTNTVSISRSLDHPGIPPYVIDYVMYHELLHNYLGIKHIHGRRYVHTPEFRRAEKRFIQLEEAQQYLAKLSQK